MGGDAVARSPCGITLALRRHGPGGQLPGETIPSPGRGRAEGVLPGHRLQRAAPLRRRRRLDANCSRPRLPRARSAVAAGDGFFFVGGEPPVSAWLWGLSRAPARRPGALPSWVPWILPSPRARRCPRGARGGNSSPRPAAAVQGIFAYRPAGPSATSSRPWTSPPGHCLVKLSKQGTACLGERGAARRLVPIRVGETLSAMLRVIEDAADLGVLRPLLQTREVQPSGRPDAAGRPRTRVFARVVNARGETLGIITTKRLRGAYL